MMGKMNIKLPMPTQFDKKITQLNEWAGEEKVYLTIHNGHIHDHMNESERSIETIDIKNILEDYTADDVTRLRIRFPTTPAKDEEEYEEYNDMTVTIRRKKKTQTCHKH
eukprot:3864710-Amphidinium_carterae.1